MIRPGLKQFMHGLADSSARDPPHFNVRDSRKDGLNEIGARKEAPAADSSDPQGRSPSEFQTV